jgi:transketolase
MGDIQGTVLTEGLYRVSPAIFDDVVHAQHDAAARSRAFAALARINALYMIARAGSGHIGSSFSALDIVSWLYLAEMRRDGSAPDIFFSSKGHDAPGLYSVMIGLGILDADLLDGLRRLGRLPGHPDVSTPGIAFNTGSLGMGIAKAKGVIEANRLSGIDRRVYVMTGDGELQEGQFWESLTGAVNRKLSTLTAIVDHNKFQSDLSVASTSDLGDLASRVAACGWHVERCDGHDFSSLEQALAAARSETDVPSLIIADTVKGRGVSFMEHTSLGPSETFYRFHSGAPSREDYARAVGELIDEANSALAAIGLPPIAPEPQDFTPAPASIGETERLVPAYSDAIIAAAEANPDIVALDADLILDTGLIPFRDRFPERFIECGIAEQDMVSQAGGLARQGKLPFVHSFACFLATRPNEQIYNNASERTKIVYTGTLAGLLPAGPGHSHQSVRDISALNGIPGLILVQPGCADEVALAVNWAARTAPSSVYIRLCSIPYPKRIALPDGFRFDPGRGYVIAGTNSDEAVLIAYGPIMLNEAVTARDLLADRGIGLTVVNLPWLNRVDTEWLSQTVDHARHLFTLDDHYLSGGQGEMIAARIAESGLTIGVTRFGLDRLPLCGRNDEVLAAHGLDAATLAVRIEENLTA